MTVAGIAMGAGYVFSGEYAEKWQAFKSNRLLHIFLLFFVVHLIGFGYSTDMGYAIEDIKKKLPILYLPVILSYYGPKLSRYYWVLFAHVFIGACLVVTGIGFAKYLGLSGKYNYRDLSPFISHIRLALSLVLAIGFCVLLAIQSQHQSRKMIYGLSVGWLLFFLNLMQSATAFAILIPTAFVGLIFYGRQIKNKSLQIASILALVLPLVFLIFWGVNYFVMVDDNPAGKAKIFTYNGNYFYNNVDAKHTENGHHVYINIATDELDKDWPIRVKHDFPQHDTSNLNQTALIRYMASMNLLKDSIGITQLSKEDVGYILANYTNYKQARRRLKFLNRLDEICFELQSYFSGENPSNHSIPQRIEYFKAGANIASNHLLFGVGTGDVKQAYKDYYISTHSKLTKDTRRRAHNQWLTFVVAFGIFGFVICSIALLYPVYKTKITYAFGFFLGIALLSFLSEDTLETQAGATFFGLFYSIFVFAKARIVA